MFLSLWGKVRQGVGRICVEIMELSFSTCILVYIDVDIFIIRSHSIFVLLGALIFMVSFSWMFSWMFPHKQ